MAGRVYVGNLALSVTERDLEDEVPDCRYFVKPAALVCSAAFLDSSVAVLIVLEVWLLEKCMGGTQASR